jgi:hypothetical protein
MNIPRILLDHIREGQVVLFLGSGASIGAKHRDGIEPPIGNSLGTLLSERFLGGRFKNRNLESIAELAISENDLISVQYFIKDIFDGFHPSDFHKIIPTFKWQSIVTTNYDLIIERSYIEVKDKIQELVVFKKNGERIEEKLKSDNNLIYIKLHGCITNIVDSETPLILTPEQYITHKKGRNRLFERLESMSNECPILFVGHSLEDKDIRKILLELSDLNEAKPRSYIIAPEMTEEEIRLWSNRKFTCINGTFEEFLNQVSTEIPVGIRSLLRHKKNDYNPLLDKYSQSNSIKPSNSLLTLLTRDLDYIHKGYKFINCQAKSFYKGYFNDMSPIICELDVRRSLVDIILSEIFLATESQARDNVEFIVIKGHAGSGKSILLRRIAWEASVDYEKICLFVKQNAHIEYEPIFELFQIIKERIYIFVDCVTENKETIDLLINKSRKDGIQITIISAERHSEWNIECLDLESYTTKNYELKYLNEKEIIGLIILLEKHDSLGHMKGMTREKQIEELSKRAGRQLLVALHEATFGMPFSKIIIDEYKSIGSPKAQALYLTICILHRIGIHTRAGLISRIHDIPFSYFKERLFKPLEYIVFTSKDELINDYYYRTRHSHIAEIVFEQILSDPHDRFSAYLNLINNLDIDYSSDREAFKSMLNAKKLIQLFQDSEMIRDLFKAAMKRSPNDPKLMQQAAIFEMKSKEGNLDAASKLLQTAHELANYDKTISHSLSELALKKSLCTDSTLEKNKLRNESRTIAYSLISKGTVESHPYQTLIKISIDEIEDIINDPDQQSVMDRMINELDKLISEALQEFPDCSHILDSESRFSELINNHPKAKESLEKAYRTSKRNPYIVSRLSHIYENDGFYTKSIDIIKECIDLNPNNKPLNFRLSQLLMKYQESNKSEIKHALRKSFIEGDSNFMARFWYARLLYIEGETITACKHFDELRNTKIDNRTKNKPRGIIINDGISALYSGSVSQIENSYAFVQRDAVNDKIYSYYDNTDRAIWQSLRRGDRIVFNIGFNFKGPIALSIKKEHS